jgi:hypothetical protein
LPSLPFGRAEKKKKKFLSFSRNTNMPIKAAAKEELD